ncbi:glucosylceramidase [Gemmatimonadetes bacterium T265]|nr:glucosylceramidase [Gemmatimonadetes bacterium T265]
MPPRDTDVGRRAFLRTGAVGLGAAAGLPALARAAHRPAPNADAAPRAPVPSPAGPIRVYQTAGARRHAALPDLAWRPSAGAPNGGPAGTADVVLAPDRRRQAVLGFGAAFTDAACYTFNRLTPAARAALFHELYHPSEMGLNVGRACVGASDYSTVAYSYDESPTPDPDLARFSIAHDRQWILPMLREARAANPDLFLLASPWSPPAWMKDNNSMLGGTIRRRYLAPYANYLTKFVQAYGAEGVPVHALTTQNELDTDQDGAMPACAWPQEAEIQFVGQHLGPALARASVPTQIWLIDHNYSLWGRALSEFEDDAVRRYADGVAWHGYVGVPTAMTRVHDAYPDKHAYWTEGGPDVTSPRYATDWAPWAVQFADILRNWSRCIIAWNYALDEHGKPNIGPFACGGLVTVHSGTREVTRSGMYWAFAHVSRHVRRGARVFESTGGTPPGGAGTPAEAPGGGARPTTEFGHVAFENPDGSRVLLLANTSARPLTPRVVLGASAVDVALPPDSVTTIAWSA